MNTPSSALPGSDAAPARLQPRDWILIGLVLASWIATALAGPIRQPQAYYLFADRRAMLGIPNFCDVTTNLPFLFIGLAGLTWGFGVRSRALDSRPAWLAMFAGIASIGLGSAYFHWNPQDTTLVWDRASLAVGFIGFFIAVLWEYVNPRAAKVLLGPAVVMAVASVFYWRAFNDLRPYLWIQFTPMLLIPVVMVLYRPRFSHAWITALVLGVYAAAKMAELGDVRLFEWTGGRFSGHSLKHLLGALACFGLLVQLRRRHALPAVEPGIIDSGAASGSWRQSAHVRRSPQIL